MSNKWTLIGTNSLESYNLENTLTNPEEKKRIKRKRMAKLFQIGLQNNRMKVEKPKKNFVKQTEEDNTEE